MSAVFLLDPAYAQYEPGKSELKRSTVLNLQFAGRSLKALGLLLVTALFLWIYVNGAIRENLFQRYGQSTAATITNCVPDTGRSSSRAVVDFVYTVPGGQTYPGHTRLTRMCQDYPAGDMLHVIYVSIDPRQVRITEDDIIRQQLTSGLCTLPITLVALVIIARCCLTLYHSASGEFIYRRLRHKSVVLDGELIAVTKAASRWRYSITLEYRFMTPRKRLLGGIMTVRRNDFRRNRPFVGTPVRVLYADDNAYVML